MTRGAAVLTAAVSDKAERSLGLARPWARWVFRVILTLNSVVVCLQPVWAGGFLAGHYDLLAWHRGNGVVAGYTGIAVLAAAVLLWQPGGGPGWPSLVCTGVLVAVMAQIALGFARVLSVHVPLGVTVITATVFLLLWAWRPARGRSARQ